MKLVACKNFANVPSLGLKVNPEDVGFVHPLHVHKGYRFDIGTGKIYGDSKTQTDLTQPERTLIAQLIVSKSAVIDDGSSESKAVIARIDAEVAVERKADAAAAKVLSQPEMIAAAVASALTPYVKGGKLKPAADAEIS
jgi:hypothetical protein